MPALSRNPKRKQRIKTLPLTSPSFRFRQNPSSFPFALQWMLHTDYADKLTPEEQAFLFAFHEAEYGGNGKILYEDIEEVRRLWRENKKQQHCVLNNADYGLPMEEMLQSAHPEDAIVAMIDAQDLANLKARAQERRRLAEKAEATELRRKRRRKQQPRASRRQVGNA